jgi:hypothetical protein
LICRNLYLSFLATLAEEEGLDENGDVNEELRLLNEENEMSVEELRRRYYGETAPAEPALPNDVGGQPSSSALSTFASVQPLKSLFVDNVIGSDDEDDEYVPKAAEYWKKDIRVGDDYQVSQPVVIFLLS